MWVWVRADRQNFGLYKAISPWKEPGLAPERSQAFVLPRVQNKKMAALGSWGQTSGVCFRNIDLLHEGNRKKRGWVASHATSASLCSIA